MALTIERKIGVRMRKYLKKYKKKIAIIAIITLFVIPLCIHILFKMQAPLPFLVAEWSAGDILAFYGVLVGAAATVAGVYISIHASQENYREDVRNRSLPYITVTPRFIQTRNFLEKYEEDGKTQSAYKPEFKEYSLEKVYYVISDGRVSIKKELSDSEYEVYSLMISGLKYNEISILLDKNLKQIDNTIQRVKTKIRKILDNMEK